MICRIVKEQDELAVFLVDAYQKLDIVCSVDPVIEFTVVSRRPRYLWSRISPWRESWAQSAERP